jgi:LysR family glycine cleavage system transcriptional activator
MPRRLAPLNALRAFEAAARLGRMNAAAKELAVTPGAISRQVKQLEESLNVQLFEGSKHKPQLTAAARVLLPALSAALDQIEASVRAVSNGGAEGTLDVSCFSTFTVKWLIPRLFDFHAQHPEIEVRLQATGQAADSQQERVDVVIAVDALAQVDEGTTTVLFPERLGVVLAPALVKRSALQSPSDLSDHTLLQTHTRQNAWQMWADAMGCAPPTQSGPTFEHYYFTLQAAIGGLGLAVAPWHLVADDVQAGRLVAPFGFAGSGLHYVARRRVQRNCKVDVFCAWLQTQAQASPEPQAQSLGN